MNRVVILVSLFALGACVLNMEEQQNIQPKFEPNWESLKKHETPEWFRDAKLGIFIHWGVYSVPAFGGEWYPRQMYMDSMNLSPIGEVWNTESPKEYFHYKEVYGGAENFGYKDFIPEFKGEHFDATEWIKIFKKAGAKYVVPVAEHHDGFAMYDSKFTKWNATNMRPKRDVLGEIRVAALKEDMHFGASTHFAFHWGYYIKRPEYDTSNPDYEELNGRSHEPFAPADSIFMDWWWNRTFDIVNNYKPEILYFDFFSDKEEFAPYLPRLAADYYNKETEWGTGVVLQTKNFDRESFPEGTRMQNLERGKLAGISEEPWQTCTSLGVQCWGYMSDWETRLTNDTIDDLIGIVSKNGNMLLNVGPKKDGTIPEDQVACLMEIGDWLSIDCEAIYDTCLGKNLVRGLQVLE